MLFRAIKRHFSTTDHFAQHFKSTFPVHRKRPIRAVGREAEYPVVWKDGTAADVRLLLSTIAEKTPGTFKATHESAFDRLLTSQDSRHLVGLLSLTDGGTELTLEVGWGTIEIGTPVCENLFELQRVYESALSLVVESAQSLGMHVLGYGIHPRTAPTLELLSPKARYSVLKKVIGQDWLSFTVSASDQLHVDVSRDEMVDVLNVSNMLSSVVIALCGNSSVYAGQQSAFSSSREGLMSSMPRHGMPSKPFRSVEDYIDRVCDLPFLMRPTNRGWVSVGGKTFREYASEHGADWASFLAHDHYVWYSARARTKQGTVELRSACQQPHSSSSDHMAAAALQLGIVEAHGPILKYLKDRLGGNRQGEEDEEEHLDRVWTQMNALRRHATRHGLSAFDQDGHISISSPFEQFDGDENIVEEDELRKDKSMSREEWRNRGYDEKLFDQLDRNQDGVVDENEWDAAALPRRLCDAARSGDVGKMQRLLVGLPHDDVVSVVLAASRQDMSELRTLLDVRSADFSHFPIPLHEFLRDILDMCKISLESRGLGEETFLDSLYERLEHQKNPAQKIREVSSSGGISALIDYATIQTNLLDNASS